MTSTLQSETGTCPKAKAVSHDKISFDASGNYESPVPGIISCSTLQKGCFIEVDCTSPVMPDADALLTGQLSSDATSITGSSQVTGDYAGCREVIYAEQATQIPAS